jgi:uncharacterized protein (DUF2141 family)
MNYSKILRMTYMKTQKKAARYRINSTLFLIFLLSSLVGYSQTQDKKGNLKVVVTNIKDKTGQIGFFLFNSVDGFPVHTEKALLSGFVKVYGNSAEYTFINIAKGTYAVYVFHDEDNDKKLSTNFIGMPKEGIGVSKNAKGHFGPPKYEDAKFNFIKPEETITISLTYL